MKTGETILEATALFKRYGNLTVLADFNLELLRGETLAVTGASGSGKSTLLGLLAGLEAPSQGRVMIEGNDITAMGEGDLASFRGRRIGFVFQSYRLLPTLSALENVRVPLDLAGRKDGAELAAHWLDRVGLAARARHLPSQLSGGEQQRVAIARAMAPSPALLMADEPTGNLDSGTGAMVRDLIFELAVDQNASLILVTHDEEVASRAGRRIHLKDGRIAP
ncbi:MAG: ABC transporter ATP-binding protein [candidate division FCPU426 bacterium]